MEFYLAIFTSWLFYLIPLPLIAVPTWLLGQKQVQWNRWNFARTALPFAIWAILTMAHPLGKSFSNITETIYLSCVATPVSVIRVAIGQKLRQQLKAFTLLAKVCLTAISLWAITPGLSE